MIELNLLGEKLFSEKIKINIIIKFKSDNNLKNFKYLQQWAEYFKNCITLKSLSSLYFIIGTITLKPL